jgi:membrane protease YdiL (CAAX protease family)
LTPRFVGQAALFYGAFAVVAVAWNAFRGRGFSFFDDSLPSSLLLGAAAAGATVSLGFLTYRVFPVFKRLADELAPHILDGASRGGLVLVAIFSGVGEEMVFRGVLQEEVGLVAASIIFGLVHIGPDRRYLVWTAWAVLAGFLFGILYRESGGLLAPTVAHVLHNAVTLLVWKSRWAAKA